jgi:hypothetical protein
MSTTIKDLAQGPSIPGVMIPDSGPARKADVLADEDPKFQRMNFCSFIRGSQGKG